jgi:hypothetical protein
VGKSLLADTRKALADFRAARKTAPGAGAAPAAAEKSSAPAPGKKAAGKAPAPAKAQ